MTETHPELEYVGFWARFAASVVDTVLLALIVVPLLYGVFGAGGGAGARLDLASLSRLSSLDTRSALEALARLSGPSSPSDFLLDYVAPAAATVLFWLYKRATPGKMMVAALVVDARTGGPLTAGQAIGRYLAYYVSLLPLCLGFLWVAFDARKQGWHDKLAGTVVVRPRPAGRVSPPVTFG